MSDSPTGRPKGTEERSCVWSENTKTQEIMQRATKEEEFVQTCFFRSWWWNWLEIYGAPEGSRWDLLLLNRFFIRTGLYFCVVLCSRRLLVLCLLRRKYHFRTSRSSRARSLADCNGDCEYLGCFCNRHRASLFKFTPHKSYSSCLFGLKDTSLSFAADLLQRFSRRSSEKIILLVDCESSLLRPKSTFL